MCNSKTDCQGCFAAHKDGAPQRGTTTPVWGLQQGNFSKRLNRHISY